MSPRLWVFLLVRVSWLVLCWFGGCWLVPQSAIAAPGDAIDLDFSLPSYQPPVSKVPITAKAAAMPNHQEQSVVQLDSLFEGGTESLVARAIGNAEGTRTPTGGKTPAGSNMKVVMTQDACFAKILYNICQHKPTLKNLH